MDDKGLIITDIFGEVTEISPTEEGDIEIIKLKKGGKNGSSEQS